MLSKKVLKELLEAVNRYPGGFVVLEEGKPHFVILDYTTYQKLAGKTLKTAARPKKVLVTGGAGYIGSHTGRYLLEQGYEVTTLDNLSTGFRELAVGKFVEGDLADPEILDQVFAEGNFDAVIHFAASIEVEESVRDPLKYFLNNVVNGVNLLQIMQKYGVRNLVFSSSCTVYSEDAPVPISESAPTAPTSPYGETKLIFENILKWFAEATAISSVSLRYFNAAGASFDQTLGLANSETSLLIPKVLDVALGAKEAVTVFGNDYPTHDGTGIRDYIHVLDLVEAHVKALEYLFQERTSKSIFEVFNVGTGQGYSVLEIINAVIERTGRMVRFEIGPRRPGDRATVIADASKIKRVLGFEPKFSDLTTVIDTAWAWHKRRFGNERPS